MVPKLNLELRLCRTFENPGVAGTVPVMAAIYMTGVTHADLVSYFAWLELNTDPCFSHSN